MSILFILLIAFVTFIAVLLIIASFTKKHYTLLRSITINAPCEQVFNYVKEVKNQHNYSKWIMMDANAATTYTGVDGTVGFVHAWESANKSVGKGEQEIVRITQGEKIEFVIRFIKPFAGLANTYLSVIAIDGERTTLSWGFASSMPYPMNIMLLFMNIEGMLGGALEESLQNVKHILEQK